MTQRIHTSKTKRESKKVKKQTDNKRVFETETINIEVTEKKQISKTHITGEDGGELEPIS